MERLRGRGAAVRLECACRACACEDARRAEFCVMRRRLTICSLQGKGAVAGAQLTAGKSWRVDMNWREKKLEMISLGLRFLQLRV